MSKILLSITLIFSVIITEPASAGKPKTKKQEKITINSVQKLNALMNTPVDTLDKLAAIFPKSVEQINEWTESGMQLAQQELDTILAIPAQERTFNNTARALDISKNKVNRLSWMFDLIGKTSPDNEIRETAQTAQTHIEQFLVDLYLNPALYQAFQEYLAHHHKQETLNNENNYFLDETIKGFKREGLHLPSKQLAKAKRLKKELVKLGNNFVANISADLRTISVTLDGLAGFSKDFIAGLKKEGNHYLLGPDVPTYQEVMQKCRVSETRHALFLAYENIAYPSNDALLKEIIQKRDTLAKLLGYKNFASLDLENTMAKNETTVETFLQGLINASSKKAQKEFALLKQNLPEGVSVNDDGTLNPWDYIYAVDAYKIKNFSIDESKIAEYFPIQKVLVGIFKIYQKFLGLTFKEVQPSWSWHQDVRLIEVYRQTSHEFLGYIFLDLYQRPNKYSTGWCQEVVRSFKPSGENIPMVSTVITSFPKPIEDKPALLKHANVITFFHEFGHAMHEILGRTEHAKFSGWEVKSDFVEMPSMMFETWMFEPEILRLVSGHYQTGEPLPTSIIQKKVDLKHLNTGHRVLEGCVSALLSLQLAQDTPLSKDPAALWHSLYKQHFASLLRIDPDDHDYASFNHLAQPLYAAKYYGYLWSQVFALDIFTEVKRQGFNEAVGKKLQQLLGAGGSIEPDILLRDFLGREPNQNAFLENFGLKEAEDTRGTSS